jgi:hypothetical protein
MAQSTASHLTFPTVPRVPLVAAFDAGRLTSAGGLPWLGEAETNLIPTQRGVIRIFGDQNDVGEKQRWVCWRVQSQPASRWMRCGSAAKGVR